MQETVEMIEWTCDGCGKVAHLRPSDGLPYGYHGTVAEAHTNGVDASDVHWFACRRACIQKATLSVLLARLTS